MKYCPKCGLRNEKYNTICEGCGTVMVQKKEKKNVLPIILVILLLAVGIVVFVLYTNNHPKEVEAITVPAPTETMEAFDTSSAPKETN